MSSLGFSEVGGISFNEFALGGGKFFVSAKNGSKANHVYIFNYTDGFVLNHDYYSSDCYSGKMIFLPGAGFGIGNNSGRYTFYKIFAGEDDFGCDKPVNLAEGSIVKGFAYDYMAEGGKYLFVKAGGNLTKIDFFVNEFGFRYQFKDKKLGYGVAENFNTLKYADRLYLPADRNYSFMIYPEGGPGFPVSIELNNLAHGNNISLGNAENRTITSVSQALYLNLSNLNLTTEIVSLSGYSFIDDSAEFENYTIIAYLLEAGNMVFLGGMMPQNMGQRTESRFSDVFNITTGFYNMSLPAAVYGADILLVSTAKKDSKWYAGFRTITLNYGESAPQLNFSLYRMLGEEGILESRMGTDTVNTSLFAFNILSNGTSVTNVHAEIKVDYSNFVGSNVSFSWMADSGESSKLKIPLLNKSVSIKVFSPQYPPIKKSVKIGELQEASSNISLETLSIKKPNGDEMQNVSFRNFRYKSDGSCSVPYPSEQPGANGCLPDGVGQGQGPPNPFSWVISGGKYDLEMRMTLNNITVHYVNVDLLASQPPNAMFDENANRSTSGSLMNEAWRFGSMGPNIYDYVLIGVPYNASALNESSVFKVNITKFHDEDWAPVWEQGKNSTDALSGTEYEDYKSEGYYAYINGSAVFCNESDTNLTSGLCYKDTTRNMLWFKIPHFSGIEPNIVGDAIVVSSGDDDGNDNTGGSSGGGAGGAGTNASYWTSTYDETDKDLSSVEINKVLSSKQRIKLNVNNQIHYVGVISLTSTSATINVSSTPQQAVLNIGESKKFDLDNDAYYDLLVKLNSIVSNKANLTITGLHEAVSTSGGSGTTSSEGQQPGSSVSQNAGAGETGSKIGEEEKEAVKIPIWLIILAVLVIIGLVIFFIRRKK